MQSTYESVSEELQKEAEILAEVREFLRGGLISQDLIWKAWLRFMKNRQNMEKRQRVEIDEQDWKEITI